MTLIEPSSEFLALVCHLPNSSQSCLCLFQYLNLIQPQFGTLYLPLLLFWQFGQSCSSALYPLSLKFYGRFPVFTFVYFCSHPFVVTCAKCPRFNIECIQCSVNINISEVSLGNSTCNLKIAAVTTNLKSNFCIFLSDHTVKGFTGFLWARCNFVKHSFSTVITKDIKCILKAFTKLIFTMWKSFMFVIRQIAFVSTPTTVAFCMVSESMRDNAFNCFFDFFLVAFVLHHSIGKAFDQIYDDLLR